MAYSQTESELKNILRCRIKKKISKETEREKKY